MKPTAFILVILVVAGCSHNGADQQAVNKRIAEQDARIAKLEKIMEGMEGNTEALTSNSLETMRVFDHHEEVMFSNIDFRIGLLDKKVDRLVNNDNARHASLSLLRLSVPDVVFDRMASDAASEYPDDGELRTNRIKERIEEFKTARAMALWTNSDSRR